MKYIDLQEAFETELNLVNDGENKPLSIDTEYFLNSALDIFYKGRYSGMNIKRESFEQTQKRIDDLRTLVTKLSYNQASINQISTSLYSVELPDNYILLLGDTAGIAPADGIVDDCWDVDEDGNYIVKYSDTIEGTIDTIDRIKENSLSEYHLHYTKAKPIRMMQGNEIQLHTDGKYKVSIYDISYLRKPIRIDIHTEPFAEYTDMPEHTHLEIVKIAARLYIENKANVRYQTYSNEVATME